MSMKSKSSSGFDGVSTQFLKQYCHLLSEPITLIINQSLNTGIFPDKLKIAKVIPVHKDPLLDRNMLNNYRPISILPSISKIFERVAYNQLYSYFSDNNIFYKSQYGFRKTHSTESAALELVNRIHEYLDKNLTPLAIYMDLSKAFDTINHEILLQKLKKYGLSEKTITWFSNYLNSRKQFVSYNNTSSSFSNISTGVPQGSILGPLLFIIYVNDIYSVTNLDLIMYADDTCLLTPIAINHSSTSSKTSIDTADTLNQKLNCIYNWLSANKLSLNISKTKCMLFHYKQKNIFVNEYPDIKINNTSLKYEEHYKFLGFFLDNTLSWNYHIHNIANKISKTNGLLSKLKYFFPCKILIMIYNTLILSRLNYGITLWGFGSCDRIKTIQKKAIRNINKAPFYSHTKPLCKTAKLLLFDDIFNLSCLKFFYNYQRNMIPVYFRDIEIIKRYFPKRNNLRNRIPNQQFPNYITDSVNFRPQYLIPKTKSKSSENRLAFYIPKLLNSGDIFHCILEKIDTHSLQGFSHYFKNKIIENYNPNCNIVNCFICNTNM